MERLGQDLFAVDDQGAIVHDLDVIGIRLLLDLVVVAEGLKILDDVIYGLVVADRPRQAE